MAAINLSADNHVKLMLSYFSSSLHPFFVCFCSATVILIRNSGLIPLIILIRSPDIVSQQI